MLGTSRGAADGINEGDLLGGLGGSDEGVLLGTSLGTRLGSGARLTVGVLLGWKDGASLGAEEGVNVGPMLMDGAAVSTLPAHKAQRIPNGPRCPDCRSEERRGWNTW